MPERGRVHLDGHSSLFTRNMIQAEVYCAGALIFGKWRPVQTVFAVCVWFERSG